MVAKGPRNEPPPGMIVPKHGGGLLKPIQKGEARNPRGHGGAYHETVRLARQASPDAMRKLIERMDSTDERVAVVAQQAVLDRAFGKAQAYDPKQDRTAASIDTSGLTSAERAVLLALLRRSVLVETEEPASAGDEPPTLEGEVEGG